MNKIDTITIPKAEYVDLLIAREMLARLEAGGVDNWGYYGEALNPEGAGSMSEFAKALLESMIGSHDESNVGLTYKIIPNAGLPSEGRTFDDYVGIEIFIDGEYKSSFTGFLGEDLLRELLNGKGREL